MKLRFVSGTGVACSVSGLALFVVFSCSSPDRNLGGKEAGGTGGETAGAGGSSAHAGAGAGAHAGNGSGAQAGAPARGGAPNSSGAAGASDDAGAAGDAGGAAGEAGTGGGNEGVPCGSGPACEKYFSCTTGGTCVDNCSLGIAGNKDHCCADTDCVSKQYCVSASCVAHKPAGAVCGDDAECSSANCGGRCCAAGVSCTCPQPTSGNLLKNPGFDKDLSGWTVDSTGAGEITWSGPSEENDVSACPYSGHVNITVSSDDSSKRISQCVAVTAYTDYYFNAFIANGRFNPPNGDFAGCNMNQCDLDWFPAANCAGSASHGASSQWLNTDWGPTSPSGPLTAPSTAVSARVSCYIEEGRGPTTPCYAHFDKVWLSTTRSY